MILAPSKTSMDYIKENSNKKPFLFPIATNTARFNENIPVKKEYSSDYCFTGSYWNNPRDIMTMLEPEELPYDFKLYGKNWDKIKKFKNYYQGFVDYSKLPEVYASTKIVIDDANIATKNYGAVNSRVFDALACGTLVLTNGMIGAEDTFNGKLPFFKTKKELNHLIKYYLSNDDERRNKVNELQEFVLKKHTYMKRANTLKALLAQDVFSSNPIV
jgi:spore maturation protein CgeB